MVPAQNECLWGRIKAGKYIMQHQLFDEVYTSNKKRLLFLCRHRRRGSRAGRIRFSPRRTRTSSGSPIRRMPTGRDAAVHRLHSRARQAEGGDPQDAAARSRSLRELGRAQLADCDACGVAGPSGGDARQRGPRGAHAVGPRHWRDRHRRHHCLCGGRAGRAQSGRARGGHAHLRDVPDAHGARFLELWQEFEDAETPEARFAHALDRAMPALLNLANEGQSWRERHHARQGRGADRPAHQGRVPRAMELHGAAA